MLCAVIGNGPRTGTTFVMGKLYEAGLPVVWDKTIEIPGAGYDILPEDVFHVEQGIVKIWPPILPYIELQRAVVLRRDPEAQLHSIREQYQREKDAGCIIDTLDLTPEQIKEPHEIALNKWLQDRQQHKTEILEVKTEDLDRRIADIVYWMGAPYLRRAG